MIDSQSVRIASLSSGEDFSNNTKGIIVVDMQSGTRGDEWRKWKREWWDKKGEETKRLQT